MKHRIIAAITSIAIVAAGAAAPALGARRSSTKPFPYRTAQIAKPMPYRTA